MCTLAGWAIGRGDGMTKANAIEFDWANGNVQTPGLIDTYWYRVALDPLYEEDNPTLALYLTNLSDEDVVVTLDATLAGSQETRTYTIPSKQNKIWSVQAGMLIRMKQTEVYLTLKANKKVALSAKVYETQDIDEACLNATMLRWNTPTSVSDTVWQLIDLQQAKTSGQDMQIVYTATSATSVEMATSFDCPSTGLTERLFALSAGESYTYTMPSAMVAALVEDELYLRTIASAGVQVKVQLAPKPAVPVINQSDVATEIVLGQRYDVTVGQHLYKVNMESLRARKKEPLFTFLNEGATDAHLVRKVALERPAYSTIETAFEVAADNEQKVVIEKNMIDGISTDIEWAYILLTTDQPVSFVGRLKHIHEGDACKTSVDFDWENGHLQEANTTVWYTIPIGEAKANRQDIVVHGLNRGSVMADVKTEFAFECPYIDLQSLQRGLEAGGQVDKTFAYSTYSMMGSDTVYVGVTTTAPMRIWADTLPAQAVAEQDICHDAVELDMTYGARQNANDTAWYAIPVSALKQMDKVPYICFRNMSQSLEEIHYAITQECPSTVAYENLVAYVNADSEWSMPLARDLVNSIANETIYLRVISSQETAVTINMVQENAGSSCRSAILFNWVSGNDQLSDDNLWYLVDLSEAKAGNKDLEISITNKDNVAGHVVAQLAYDCPCEAPQNQSLSLSAGATRSRVLTNTTLETVGDTLYIRLESSTAIHVEARLIDPAPFETIECPETVIPLEWNTLYTQTTDTAWYYISHEVLSQLGETELTPQVYIHNLTNHAGYLRGDVAYHCPVTAAMMSKALPMSNNAKIYKLVERSTAEQLMDKDSIMLRLITDSPFEFKAELIDPNTGDDCAHALLISTPDTLAQAAGTDKWYKLNVSDAAQLGGMLVATVENVDEQAGRVRMDVHIDCDSLPLISRDTLLGVGDTYVRDYACDVFVGAGTRYVFVHVQSEVALQLSDTLRAYVPVTPISVCDSAIAIVPNLEYEQQLADQWYSVDMKSLRLNTGGDVELLLYNDNTTDLDWQLSLGWECNYKHEWTTRAHHIAAQDSVVKTYLRSQVSQLSDSTLYLRVHAEKPMRFVLNAELGKGEACDNAILFDWENGNIHPAGDYLWYQVRLDSTMIPDSCDLRLHLDNLNRTDSTVANADLYFDCRDVKIAGMTYTMAPDSSKYKDIDRDLLASLGWANMLINYHSDYNTHMWVELVVAKERGVDRDTIRAFVCDGEEYTDTITGMIYTISSDMDFSDPHMWTDTVAWRDGTTMRDSITTFIVTPIVAPNVPSSIAELEALDAMPLLAQGMQLFVDSSETRLRAYFEELTAADSVETMEELYWAKPVTNRKEEALDLTTYFTKDDDLLKMRLVFKGACGSVIRKDITFPIDEYKYVTRELSDTVCPTATLTENTTLVDTLPYQVLVADTLGLMRQVDTIVTTNTYIWQAPELFLPEELASNLWPTVKNDQLIVYTANQMRMLLGLFAQNAEELTMPIDTIVWEHLTDTGYESIDGYVVPVDTLEMTLRYTLITICGDQMSSEAFAYTLSPCEDYVADTTVVTCGAYEWRGEIYTESCDTTRRFPMLYGCDSILTLHLTIGESYLFSETITDCRAYEWHGEVYAESGIYYDSLLTVLGCDSVYELNLTIKPVEDVQIPVVAKYDYWILMINRSAIEQMGYTFTPEQVAWYRLVDEVDNWALDEQLRDDELVATGDYYTTGQRLEGSFYAMITLPGEDDCPVRLMSDVINDPSAPKWLPALCPNTVAPGETMQLIHLDPTRLTDIYVYDMQGVLQAVYQSVDAEQFLMKAAEQQGHYMVRLDAEGQTTTLRYVVK